MIGGVMGKQFSFTKLNSQKKKFQLEQAVLLAAKQWHKTYLKEDYYTLSNTSIHSLAMAVEQLTQFEEKS